MGLSVRNNLTVVALVVGATIGSSLAAYAYPLRKNACDDLRDVRYYFAGSSWTDAYKSDWDKGAAKWNAILDSQGNPFTSSGSNGSKPVYRRDLGGETRGEIECSVVGSINYMALDDQVPTGTSTIGVAAHEVGHAHGVGHTGKHDGFDGQTPTMVCPAPSLTDLSSLQHDDYGSATATFSIDASANPSFENELRFWSHKDDLGFELRDSGGAAGPRYVRFKGGANGWMGEYQRLTDTADLNARLNYKKWSTSDRGSVTIELWGRRLAYPNDHPFCFPSVDSQDLNATQVVGDGAYRLKRTKTATITDEWSYTTTNTWTDVDGWDGADVLIKIRSTAQTSSGAATWVRIDHARIRHILP